MSNLNLPNLKHLEGKPLPGRTTYEVKGSKFVEVSPGGLEAAFQMLQDPEAEVNPRYRAVVGGYVHLKNALLQARAGLKLWATQEEREALISCAAALQLAVDNWPIKLPASVTDLKPSQTPPDSAPQAAESLEE